MRYDGAIARPGTHGFATADRLRARGWNASTRAVGVDDAVLCRTGAPCVIDSVADIDPVNCAIKERLTRGARP